MRTLILNKRPLSTTPYHEWLPDTKDDVVLFTAKSNQNDDYLTSIKPHYKELRVYENYDVTGKLIWDALQLHKEAAFTRVIALSEVDILRAAEIREALGIPGQSVESARAFRDKFIMKSHVQKSKVLVAPMAALSSAMDAIAFVSKHGYPVVIKPRSSAGSMGVKVIRTEEGFLETLDKGLVGDFSQASDLMIEGFVAGPMFHVDGLANGHDVLFSWTSRYVNDNLAYLSTGEPSISAMLGSENPLTSRFQAAAAATIRALPLADAVFGFHAEFFLTSSDAIVLCEIACRVGGGGINDLIESGFGINLNRLSTELQSLRLAIPPTFPKIPKRLAADLLLPPKQGQLLEAPGASNFPFVTVEQTSAKIGKIYDTAQNANEKLGFFVYHADDEKELLDRANAIIGWFDRGCKWKLTAEAPEK